MAKTKIKIEPMPSRDLEEIKLYCLHFAEVIGCPVLLLPSMADKATEIGLVEGVHFKRMEPMPVIGDGRIYVYEQRNRR